MCHIDVTLVDEVTTSMLTFDEVITASYNSVEVITSTVMFDEVITSSIEFCRSYFRSTKYQITDDIQLKTYTYS